MKIYNLKSFSISAGHKLRICGEGCRAAVRSNEGGCFEFTLISCHVIIYIHNRQRQGVESGQFWQ